MSKFDIYLIKIIDWLLLHVFLRTRYKRNSNQHMRTWYFYKHFNYIIEKHRDVSIPQIENDGPIWFFWWQGEDAMPPIVKKCYNLAKEHAPEGHPVVLLTKENHSHYVNIPIYILNKVKNKTITLTHYSDILRVALLAKHGGLWMDATLYTAGDIPEHIFEQQFFSVRTPDDGQWVSKCLWTGFFMGGVKGHPLFKFMQQLFFDYWKNHTELLDYFLIDLGIRMAYDNIPRIRESIDAGVWKTDKMFVPEKNITKPIDRNSYNKLISEWKFFKMTYRDYFGKLIVKNEQGQYTWYGYMLEN